MGWVGVPLCSGAGGHCNLALADKPMQMNQALFMTGGHCGYVLQPGTMRDEAFDPFDKSSLRGLEPCAICIEVGLGMEGAALQELSSGDRDGVLVNDWGRGTELNLSLRKI